MYVKLESVEGVSAVGGAAPLAMQQAMARQNNESGGCGMNKVSNQQQNV